MGPVQVWTGAKNLTPTVKFCFVFTCTLRACFFVLIVLHFALCLNLQHTTQNSMSPAGLFLSVCTLSVLLCPGFAFVLTVQQTQHKHPCPRRDSNPQSQKRSVAIPRLRLLGHWDRQVRSLDPPARNQPLHRLRYSGS